MNNVSRDRSDFDRNVSVKNVTIKVSNKKGFTGKLIASVIKKSVI